MTYQRQYAATEPLRSDVDRMPGRVVVEFGAPWCGHCRDAQPALQALLRDHPDVPHIKIEDGKGRPLGRSFGVRLWPTIVVLERGREVARVVRPCRVADLEPVATVLAPRIVASG